MTDPFEVTTVSETETEGRVVIEPLRQGFGHTLGNGLRRVMLSALPGAAVTRLKIKGVRHQFSTLSGMREDVVELVLNVKQLRVAYQGEAPETMKLAAAGPGAVTAAAITAPATVKIANPDLVLAVLSSRSDKLEAELTVEAGTGYTFAEEQGRQKLGVIPLDADFSPVVKVFYTVEATRVGRRTDYDRLVLAVTTDGTIKPSEAVVRAAEILVEHFQQVVSPQPAAGGKAPTAGAAVSRRGVLELTVEELGLPTRVANALRRGGYETVGELVASSVAEISNVKNVGEKSVEEIVERVAEQGVEIPS